MKDVMKLKKGEKLTLSRKAVNGEIENVEVEFNRAVTSDPNRCWVTSGKHDFRVAVSKLTPIGERVPAHVQYGQAEEPQEGNAEMNVVKSPAKNKSPKTKIPKVEIIPDELKSSEKVETTIKKKEDPKPEVKTTKKVVDTKEEAKVSKVERVVRFYVKNPDMKREEAAESIGCHFTYYRDTTNLLKQVIAGASKESLLEKYPKWLTDKRISGIINSYKSCQK